jgi:hypothetical protein
MRTTEYSAPSIHGPLAAPHHLGAENMLLVGRRFLRASNSQGRISLRFDNLGEVVKFHDAKKSLQVLVDSE